MRFPAACSELENIVLAMIAEGVSSGYAMRKYMGQMWGGRWSTESGSVYRALRRLTESGLVVEEGRAGTPNRQRTEYRLTARGEAMLLNWLSDTPSVDDFGALNDPIRTRTHFLGLLGKTERLQVVRNWLNFSKVFLEDLRRDALSHALRERHLDRLALQNLIALAEARHDWLRKVFNEMRSESGRP